MLLPQSRQLNLIDQYRLVPGTESIYTFAFVILWIIKCVYEPGHLVNSDIELLQGNLVTLNIDVYQETWLL